MTSTDDPTNLDGKLLVAMPGMGDPRFDRSVIYLCSHGHDGAMGLIVNKASKELAFTDILNQLELEVGSKAKGIKVHFGGPVESARGFVLHSEDYTTNESTLPIGDGFGMTATLDILEDIASGRGPQKAIFALGYSGWGPGQLESEIVGNGWLTCDATEELVFGLPNDSKWAASLKSMGIDPLSLSATSGRA